jgi:nucleoside-diphosphate-sugar epimerase
VRVLVTGSSGTVGTALCLALQKQNVQVIPLDIRGNIWSDELNRQTIKMDLRQTLNSSKLPGRVDLIVHLAANARVHELVVYPKLALDNYLMVSNVLEFTRTQKIPRFLFSSSREIYGESSRSTPRKESDTAVGNIKSPYTASKFGAEALIHAYRHCYDLSTVIIRLSNVYGRYDVSERVIPLYFYNALRNRDLVVFGKEKKFDFTYIDDCIDGLCRAAARFDKVAGETFNLSTGRGEKLWDLAKSVVRETETDSQIILGQKRTGEISTFVGNIALARRKLDYKPKVSLSEGLPKAWKWYSEIIREPKIAAEQKKSLKRWGWD